VEGVNIYFKNKDTGKRFQVVAWNKETGDITLKGEYATFSVKYDKEWLQKSGYVLEKEPTNAEQPRLQT
jgi:hypothetical protein